MGRAQGHHHADSLNAELTGVWTARCCDSHLTRDGYIAPRNFHLPETILERMNSAGFNVFPWLRSSFAVKGGMSRAWLRDDPERLHQFDPHAKVQMNPDKVTKAFRRLGWVGENADRIIKGKEVQGYRDYLVRKWLLEKWCNLLKGSRKKIYAHYIVNHTHRPWGNPEGLCRMFNESYCCSHAEKMIMFARRASLENPDEFAAFRREGLAKADRIVRTIFEETSGLENTVYLVYSNHGEVFDHFRYNMRYRQGEDLYETTHGNLPYEVLYANMQMWIIPGYEPRVMTGISRSVDIAPTILDLAGISAAGLDGESMVPYFQGDTLPPRDRYAETWLGEGCISMVRADGYKFISTGKPSPGRRPDSRDLTGPDIHKLAVFHLPSDPYEYVNLIDTPQGQSVLEWAIEKHASLRKISGLKAGSEFISANSE